MNLVNDLFKYNHVLLKYMDQVKLYENDFKILDRYRGFLEIIKEYNLRGREAVILKHQLFKDEELKVFESNDNYIINCLRRHVIDEYIRCKR